MADKHTHRQDFMKLCAALGEDFDAPICKELERHVAECPDCRIIFDTVKQVVYLYRTVDRPREVPNEVHERLFRVLNLGKR